MSRALTGNRIDTDGITCNDNDWSHDDQRLVRLEEIARSKKSLTITGEDCGLIAELLAERLVASEIMKEVTFKTLNSAGRTYEPQPVMPPVRVSDLPIRKMDIDDIT